jgi:hypothetical protein
LLDPILISDSITVIESTTIHINRTISDHDLTYIVVNCGYHNVYFLTRTKIFIYTNIKVFLCKFLQIIHFVPLIFIFTLICAYSIFNILLYPPLRSPNQNDASAFDNSDKCNLLNEYFCSITDLQDDDIPLPDFDDRGPNPLTDITVVEQDIIDIISLKMVPLL